MPDDPAVQAVFEAMDEECASLTIPQLRGLAQVAVDAYRRAVLAYRPDAERLRFIGSGASSMFLWPRQVRAALDGRDPDDPAVDEEGT